MNGNYWKNENSLILAKETEHKMSNSELEETRTNYEKQLSDLNKAYKKMCKELSYVKNKLQSSIFANKRVREEIGLWKKHCKKVEEEKKAIRKEVQLENTVVSRFQTIESFLIDEKKQSSLVADLLNTLRDNIKEDLKPFINSNANEVRSVCCQTDVSRNKVEMEDNRKSETIFMLKQKEIQLVEELKKCEIELGDLNQQNFTLREVIKAMKRERENWEKEKEHIEEEARVKSLEESVRYLRNNLVNEEKDICVWNALQDVKKEISDLKHKNIYKTANNVTKSATLEVSGSKLGLPSLGFQK